MSILAVYEPDQSNALCKQFATLTSSYLDHPEQAKALSARVPLENLYRLLEMYRYDAFSDVNRRGVLALERQEDQFSTRFSDAPWHTDIQSAINAAVDEAYAGVAKTAAVQELQEAIRWLANQKVGAADQTKIAKAKTFFTKFLTELK